MMLSGTDLILLTLSYLEFCGLFHYLRDMVQMLYSELHAFCGALFFWPLPAMNPVCTTIFLVWALLPLPMLIPPP